MIYLNYLNSYIQLFKVKVKSNVFENIKSCGGV